MERMGIDNLIARWNTTLECGRLSPSVFFDMVDEEILSREIAGLQVSRVFWREHGWFSARREYLRLRRDDLVFDICGFPVGDSFVVSWWMGTTEKTVRNLFFEIPIVGEIIEEIFSPVTYYSVDETAAFQIAIHNLVLSVVDQLNAPAELPNLSQPDGGPLMSDFYE